MINNVQCYSLSCDICNEVFEDNDTSFSIWDDVECAIESAIDVDWVEMEGKHYCPECYSLIQ